MKPSVSLAISRAWEWMTFVLFKPFDLGKWCVLGFCAFLALLGQGGGGGRFNVPNFNSFNAKSRQNMPAQIDDIMAQARKFFVENMEMIIVIAAVVVVVVVILAVVLTWLSSRGMFMFLDGVVCNRAVVVAPWHRYSRQGNSLFHCRLALGFINLLVFVAIVALCVVVAWSDIAALQFTARMGIALAAGCVALLVWGAMTCMVSAVLRDFIPLVMCKRQVLVMQAWSIFFKELLPGRVGSFVCFYLMAIVLGIGIAMAMIAVCCLTCCIGACVLALPYVGSVLLLPVSVFKRSYSVCFFDQCGPEWRVFGSGEWPA